MVVANPPAGISKHIMTYHNSPTRENIECPKELSQSLRFDSLELSVIITLPSVFEKYKICHKHPDYS